MGPFDRFNDRAKRVLALAQDEAIRFNHNYIGTEHLLLGLVREGEGVAARVLDSLGVELSKVRTAVEFIIGRGDSTTSPSEITLSPRTKKVIELAIDEARKLGHSHVGTEHLLLGLVREGEGIASGVLESLGVSLEKMRHQVIATLGQHPPERAAAGAHAGGPFTTFGAGGPIDRLDGDANRALARAFWEAGRANQDEIRTEHLLLALVRSDSAWLRRAWTDLAKRVLALAQEEAVRLRHNYIGTEHVMLGLLRSDAPAVRQSLVPFGLSIESAREKIAAITPPGSEPATGEQALTPRTKTIVELARTEGPPGDSVEPEHILLALLDEGGGIGAQVLSSLGATADRIRTQLKKR